jgi:hypothetical protein
VSTPVVTVFLVSAQLQSGKDTFSDALVRKTLGQKLAFADPVKEVAISMLGMPSVVAYGGEAERRAWTRYGKDARQWLQWIGTELGRQQIHQDVWLHRLNERLEQRSCRSFVVSDARFKNELIDFPDDEWITRSIVHMSVQGPGRPCRFVLVRIKRPGNPTVDLSHVSETEQTEIPDASFDEIVVNDGTPEELAAKAQLIAEKWLDKSALVK